MPFKQGNQVSRSSQSKGGWPDREPMWNGKPPCLSRSATRRPVFPFPPITSVTLLLFIPRPPTQFCKLAYASKSMGAFEVDQCLFVPVHCLFVQRLWNNGKRETD